MHQNMLIHKAIEFATLKHQGQLRKGTEIPYIVHPFETAHILTQAGCTHEVIAAGLLHDLLEDADVSLAEIESLFGHRVAELVSSCSEDKSKSWTERKSHTIDYLTHCEDLDILRLSCADKLSNMRSIKADFDKEGDLLWSRFNQGKRDQQWYYGELIQALSKHMKGHEMLAELSLLYSEVFAEE